MCRSSSTPCAPARTRIARSRSRTRIDEGEPLIAAVRETKRVVQTGTQQRSWEHYLQAKEVIESGQLGDSYFHPHVLVSEPRRAARAEALNIDTSKLDWRRFLGSAPERPFDADQYAHWRWYWDFGGGAMTDLFVHWVDVAQWFMGAGYADPRHCYRASAPS